MCGIVGMIAKKSNGFLFKHRQMFEQMLQVDVLRGDDSTGMYQVNKHGNVRWCKEASTPLAIMEHTTAKSFMSDIAFDAQIVVGHNRKATKGTVVDENAHPFIEDDIILVHNGTLTNHKDLNAEVEVDSHAIAHVISEHGIVSAIQKLKGAYAVAAYDTKKKKLYLFRNKERPLWLAESEDGWFFASEPWMLYGMAWRNQITFTTKLVQVEENKLYTFDASKQNELSIEVVPEVKTFLPAVVHMNKGKKGGKKEKPSTSFHNSFIEGNYVVFKPETVEYSSAGTYLYGIHFADPEVRIRCHVVNGTAAKLRNMPLVCAKVRGTSFVKHTNTKLVFAANPAESNPITTINDVALNEEQIQALDGGCSRCGDAIAPDELEGSFVRFLKNKTLHICEQCVNVSLEKNPFWGNIVKQETSNMVLH